MESLNSTGKVLDLEKTGRNRSKQISKFWIEKTHELCAAKQFPLKLSETRFSVHNRQMSSLFLVLFFEEENEKLQF